MNDGNNASVAVQLPKATILKGITLCVKIIKFLVKEHQFHYFSATRNGLTGINDY
jgi:hypothetical protein